MIDLGSPGRGICHRLFGSDPPWDTHGHLWAG